jgi:predicted O-methyltransferase YrrM
MKIARFLQPEIILELGTAHGNTVANLCRQCPRAHVFTVNAPAAEQTGKLTTYSLTIDEIGRVYRSHGYTDRVTQIFANTLDLDLSSYLSKQSVNLVVIDACHDTDYVINDFSKVSPYVKSNGIVLFHDTHPSMDDHLIGSYRACMQLRKRGLDIRHIEGTWWGMWSPNYHLMNSPSAARLDFRTAAVSER